MASKSKISGSSSTKQTRTSSKKPVAEPNSMDSRKKGKRSGLPRTRSSG